MLCQKENLLCQQSVWVSLFLRTESVWVSRVTTHEGNRGSCLQVAGIPGVDLWCWDILCFTDFCVAISSCC